MGNDVVPFRRPGEACRWCGAGINLQLGRCPDSACCCHPHCACEDCQAARRRTPAAATRSVLLGWPAPRLSDSERASCAICGETVLCARGDLAEACALGAEPVCRQCVVDHRIPIAIPRARRG